MGLAIVFSPQNYHLHLAVSLPVQRFSFLVILRAVPVFDVFGWRQVFWLDAALPKHIANRTVILNVFPVMELSPCRSFFFHIVVCHFRCEVLCGDCEGGQKISQRAAAFMPRRFSFPVSYSRQIMPGRLWSGCGQTRRHPRRVHKYSGKGVFQIRAACRVLLCAQSKQYVPQ